jgi:hypothetical protein
VNGSIKGEVACAAQVNFRSELVFLRAPIAAKPGIATATRVINVINTVLVMRSNLAAFGE